MKKKTFAIFIAVLIVLLLVSSIISIMSLNSYTKHRRLFINDVYNSLKTIEEELGKFDEKNTDRIMHLVVEFAVLDKLCDTQRKYTNGAFYYENKGKFSIISENILSGKYGDAEIELLQKIISNTLVKLSDSTGLKENEHLSYKQVSVILGNMFSKIDDL